MTVENTIIPETGTETPLGWQMERTMPFIWRMYLPEFRNLNPYDFPWKQMRRVPEEFPDVHVAKVQSDRTVIGIEVTTDTGAKERIYIKRSFERSRVRRLLRHVHRTKEWRELILSNRYAEAGYIVPQPIFYGEGSWHDEKYDGPVTFYASRALPSGFLALQSHLKANPFTDTLLDSIAAFTRELHDRTILHRDYRGDHIFLDQSGPEIQWALIDLDGSILGKPVKKAARARAIRQFTQSLLNCGFTIDHLRTFIERYDPLNKWQLDPIDIQSAAVNRDR